MPKPDGFLNVRKPKNVTSAALVERIRRALMVPCGHAGTLDPMAEGVLVIGAGEARKFIRYLQDDKEYEATMRLGQESDTLDATGRLSPAKPVNMTEEQILTAGRSLVGEIELPVPIYSAVHVRGKRLYELARKGEEVTPPSRRSQVISLIVDAIDVPCVRFRVACSSGTYIRSLAAEWGRILGCGAHLAALVRLRSGRFELADSRTPEEIEQLTGAGKLAEAIVSARFSLAHLPEISAERAIALAGRKLLLPAGQKPMEGRLVRIIDAEREFIGIGRVSAGENGSVSVRPERMVAANPADS